LDPHEFDKDEDGIVCKTKSDSELDDNDNREIERKAENASDETKDTLDEAGDKMKAGVKAMGNIIKDPDKDIDTKYDNDNHVSLWLLLF
jgi:hypothetical protein